MMRISILLAAVLASFSFAHASNECASEQTGRWDTGIDNRIIEAWHCDMSARVGGLTLGLGQSVNVMAGQGELSCAAYNIHGEVAACYNEDIDMAFLGGGVGLGLSIVTSLDVHSVGIKLIDFDPENLIGLRMGAQADVSLHVLRDRIGAGASVSFSTASGVNADVHFSRARGLGLYGGAHINGFVMYQRGYLDRDDSNSVEFSPQNVVASRSDATSRAREEHPNNRNFGLTVRSSDQQLKGDSMNEFVRVGLIKARNICTTTGLKAVYAAPNCFEDDTCDSVYFRAVCH